MKIMTFNTQHCRNFLTGEIDFRRMSDAILACAPDIVGLNEMRGQGTVAEYGAQVEALAALTGMPYFYFAKAIDVLGKGPYGNGILSRIPILSVETVMIPDPAVKTHQRHYETRCVLKAVLEGGITVLVTHMGLNPDEQENAVSTVVANLARERCVLMGDFNMTPENPCLTPIFEAMTDTSKVFDREQLSFPSDAPNCKIDYIFVSHDVDVRAAEIPAIVASDHRPIVATVEF